VVSAFCLALLFVFLHVYHSICSDGGAISSELLAASYLLFAAVGLELACALLVSPKWLWKAIASQQCVLDDSVGLRDASCVEFVR
jgi:hypothetical protein